MNRLSNKNELEKKCGIKKLSKLTETMKKILQKDMFVQMWKEFKTYLMKKISMVVE
jgi:ribosomal protein S8